MKKQLTKLSTLILISLALAVSLFSCVKEVDFKVDFVVDGEVYATVRTSGSEAIKIPENPTKEGYDFDGWYWDNETFTKPFTAESLLNAPLSADMSVYAKWKIGAHTHTPGDWVVDKNATCSEAGSKHNVCTFCGATVETAAIEKLAHTPEVVPGKPQTDTEDGLTDGSRCSVCSEVLIAQQTIPANLQSTALKSANLTVSGDKITGSVSNTTEIFSFANDITVAKNASYVVATDISCSQTIASKTVTLSIGDNTFYILVSCGSDVKLYYVTLRRLPTYTVSFNTNGGSSVANQIIEEGSLATEPVAPARAGYTFTGWDYDFTSPITQNTTVSATWTANTNTVYKVEYYLEKLDGTYELKETENLVGTTDTTATAEIKTFEHFTHDTEAGVLSGNIAGDGSLVLKVYYTRDSYTVTTSINNSLAGSVTAGGVYKYGTEITVTTTITKEGYHFVGWYNGIECISTNSTYKFSATEDVVLEAKIEPDTSTPYKVEYYLEKLDGTYELKETENLSGTTDTTATSEIKTFTHFTHDTEAGILSGNIAGNGSLVLKVYYTRDYYTVTTSVDNAKAGSITAGGTYKYGTEITVTATVNPGYTFAGFWSGEISLSTELMYTFVVEETINIVAMANATPIYIYTAEQLKSIAMNGNYCLMNDIDLGGTEWTPLGTSDYSFTGTFDGNGHTVSNFKVTGVRRYAGLFGRNNGKIENLGVESFTIDVSYNSYVYAGGLVGYNSSIGTIANCYATGDVTSTTTDDYSYAGGLVGKNSGTITGCYATGAVTSTTTGWDSYAGGLVGGNYEGTITNCYATGEVTSTTTGWDSYAGGLVGYNIDGTITGCYATGAVTSTTTGWGSYAGGLVGYNIDGTITGCYRYSGQTFTVTGDGTTTYMATNTKGTKKDLATLKSVSFHTQTLGWSADVWTFTEGEHPTLKGVEN